MCRNLSVVAVVALLSGLAPQSRADDLHFSDAFNLYGNWQNYLYAATNAQVYSERVAGNATYWRPTIVGTLGTVEYCFPLSFQATSGTLLADLVAYTSGGNVPNYDPNAYAYLDVSPDGQNWTNIDGS
jgi:hypothetical protein